jgi:hypothetical protein
MVENLREKRASELPTSITIIIMDSNNIVFFIKVAIVRKEIMNVANNTMILIEKIT